MVCVNLFCGKLTAGCRPDFSAVWVWTQRDSIRGANCAPWSVAEDSPAVRGKCREAAKGDGVVNLTRHRRVIHSRSPSSPQSLKVKEEPPALPRVLLLVDAAGLEPATSRV